MSKEALIERFQKAVARLDTLHRRHETILKIPMPSDAYGRWRWEHVRQKALAQREAAGRRMMDIIPEFDQYE